MEQKDLNQDTVFGLVENAVFSEAVVKDSTLMSYHYERGVGGKVRCVQTVSFQS